MTRSEILAFFDQRQQHWNARDAVQLASDHTEHGHVRSPMHGVLDGRTAIADSYRTLFDIFPDWQFRSEDVLIDGNRVAQVFSAEATHVGEFLGLMGTNRHFRIQGVRLYELDGGLIQKERRLYDFTGLLIQVGVLKGKPA